MFKVFFYLYISDTSESIFSGPIQGRKIFKSFKSLNIFFFPYGEGKVGGSGGKINLI